MGRMDGMVAIVTGSSRGLGRAIARQFGREGATVVASARPRSPTGLPGTPDDTAQAIEAGGGAAVSIPCDVSDKDQVEAMVDAVTDRYGRIDVLVNNAGIMVIGETLMEIDEGRWDLSMGANVRGPYLMCRRVVPVMMKQGRGSIINIGSRMGYDHLRGGGVLYSSSKAALHMFSRILAEELREHNIAVNILNPGQPGQRGVIGDSLGPARLAPEGGPGRGGALRRVPRPAGRIIHDGRDGRQGRVRPDVGPRLLRRVKPGPPAIASCTITGKPWTSRGDDGEPVSG